MKVPCRRLPGSALDLPLLGLGTVAFGRLWGLKYRHQPTVLPSDLELETLLATAEEVGVNLLDTAPAYGDSELRLGRLLQHRASSSNRFLLATKVGEISTPEGSSWDFRPATVRASVERSLRRLGVDVLDLILLHSSGDDDAALLALDTLLELRHQGLVRAVGASTKTLDGGLRTINEADVVMLDYSLNNPAQRPVLDAALGCAGVLIKKPLASGHSSNPDAALRFAASHPAVSSVIVGTTNPEHLRANAAAIASVYAA